MALPSIGDFEEKPLWVTISIDIILQKKVILIVGNFWSKW